jgi:tetratricopeptide (TPR) repeat protein
VTVVLCALLAVGASGQVTSKATVDTSETLFSVSAAINACGYDQDVAGSTALRGQVRGEVAKAIHASPQAEEAAAKMCRFYHDHQQGDAGRDLAQYISLALNLGGRPAFAATLKEADLPPDAAYVAGFPPLLAEFAAATGLHAIWQRHQPEYEGLIERYHDAVSRMLLATDVYLRMPFSGYLGRKFTIYLEPMTAPSQANARNYGNDYFVIVSPVGDALRIDQVRHTYLHYALDPLASKRASTMKRLSPLLEVVKTAPMDESFKTNMELLLTESLIQAIEARTLNGGKASQAEREHAVDSSMRQGFILTQYFYRCLAKFEKEPVGLKDAYPDWLYYLNTDQEKKQAQRIAFAASATPEVVRAGQRSNLTARAETRLVAGDLEGARELAQEALQSPKEDQGRAYFILARAATMGRDMAGARNYFQKTLEVTREPRLLAWSHIYLGRILDLQEDRDAAVGHYRAALSAYPAPEVKAAAERGLKQPYEPPGHSQQ